jgi:hypothetical protein
MVFTIVTIAFLPPTFVAVSEKAVIRNAQTLTFDLIDFLWHGYFPLFHDRGHPKIFLGGTGRVDKYHVCDCGYWHL